jgi:hypothetical protein
MSDGSPEPSSETRPAPEGGYWKGLGPLRSHRLFQPAALFVFLFVVAAFFNFKTLREERRIVWIRGETPAEANFTPFITRNGGFQQGQSLELFKDEVPAAGYFSLAYSFKILEAGTYALFIAGTPPGADTPGNETEWFSPYWVSVDGAPFERHTNASFREKFPVHPRQTEYVKGGYHWSRIAWLELAEGMHRIEIQVRDRRLRDGKYAFYLDSVLLVPKDYKPKRLLKDLDPRFFS